MFLPAIRRILQISSSLVALSVCADRLTAQTPSQPRTWMLRTRAFITGGSHTSNPARFKAYSGLGLEAAIDRVLSPAITISLVIRAESREIDSLAAAGPDSRLGSVELLPISLFAQYRPLRGSLQPYLGLGGNLTVAWEKTGRLDSLQVKPSLGAAIQAGVDVPIASRGVLNLDARWNTHRLQVDADDGRLFRLKIDPLTLALGVGLWF